jgi:Arc/MetJ family transcription regulator
LTVYNTPKKGGEVPEMRTNIVLDDDLIREGLELTGSRTKRELVQMALEELVRRRKRKNLADLAGSLRFRDDFDHKSLRETRHDPR